MNVSKHLCCDCLITKVISVEERKDFPFLYTSIIWQHPKSNIMTQMSRLLFSGGRKVSSAETMFILCQLSLYISLALPQDKRHHASRRTIGPILPPNIPALPLILHHVGIYYDNNKTDRQLWLHVGIYYENNKTDRQLWRHVGIYYDNNKTDRQLWRHVGIYYDNKKTDKQTDNCDVALTHVNVKSLCRGKKISITHYECVF
jgi:hypothetical protein